MSALISQIRSFFAWPIPAVPNYTGPYIVGVHDLESSTSSTSLSSASLASHSSVLVRLFYPAGPLTGSEQRPRWLPTPYNDYAEGYGSFLKLPRWISVPWFSTTLIFTRIPGFLDAAFLAPPVSASASASAKYPTVIFSHGLGGTRTTYTSICGELASHGYVVAAIEHRDGSAAHTSHPSLIDGSKTPERIRIQYRRPEPGTVEKDLRIEQLEYRVEEVGLVIQLLKALNAGKQVRDAEKNENTIQEGGFHESQMKGALDLEDDFFVAGHSFGGATALKYLSRKDHPFKAGVAFDPWMLTIAGINVTRPILVLNSESFTVWTEHFKELTKVVRYAPQPSMILTVLKSGHQHHSDIPALYPNLFRYVFRNGEVNPARAIQLNTGACIAFLRKIRGLDSWSEKSVVLGEESGEVERWVVPELEL